VKLKRVLKFLNQTTKDVLSLRNIFNEDGSITINQFIDTSHGVHDDFRGHIGCIIAIGNSNIVFRSTKMKINTKSTAETELTGMSEEMSQSVWTKFWLEENGHKVNPINIFQDNKSTIAMIKKGKACGRNTRHINMRHFFIKDYIAKGIVEVKYLFTKEMIADILTKPLKGKEFNYLVKKLMNAE
jgi:hypothetical protein